MTDTLTVTGFSYALKSILEEKKLLSEVFHWLRVWLIHLFLVSLVRKYFSTSPVFVSL